MQSATAQGGHSLVEMLIVIGILMTLAAVALPNLKAYSEETQLVGAAKVFQGEFRKARSMAVRSGLQTAIRFEARPGGVFLSIYEDGNANGVRREDILAGVDRRLAPPLRLAGGNVRVGIHPNLPAPPPDRGMLDPRDPIRFGRGDLLSFSPLGTATPGTLYLAGSGLQAAVRVTAASARVRTLIYRGRWRER